MSIPMSSRCLMCNLQRNMEKAKALGDDQKAVAFGKQLMRMYADAPEGVSSPWFTAGTADLFREFYGLEDDQYREEKEQANRFVLERLDQIRQMIRQAPDPVYAGLQFAILGNYLDFSALQGKVSFEALEEMLRKALDIQLDPKAFGSLKEDLARGKKLLYLTDNAGEIGMDRLFAEEIRRAYPHLEIVFCVRGGIALNDATREDARAVGIPFPVIDNGNRIPGTQIDMLGEEAKKALEEADVILAKGMANCETMLGCGHNVYYAFLVKCERFADIFKQPLMTPMLVKER